MEIKKIVLGSYETNCYILEDNGQIIIDPATDEIDKYVKDLKAVLITHYHEDHVGGLDKLKKYNVPIFDYKTIGEQEIGNFKFKVTSVKGHHDTCVMFEFKDCIFVGDFVFQGTIGRTDFETGDYNLMLKSIELLKTYPNTKLYPGHGPETTLDEERKYNPYFV